eukprot:XP_001692542.1 predicted protein of CSG family [Chlamydomonas reinhardtii]
MNWDLSKLILEGQSSPVSSAVVLQWLDLVYSRIDRERRPPKFSSLSEELRSLLLFMDAVGTCGPVLDAFEASLTALPSLALAVTVGGGGAEGAGGNAAGGAPGGADGAGGGGGGGGEAPPPAHIELMLCDHIYYLVDGGLGSMSIPSGARFEMVKAQEFAPYNAYFRDAVAAALEGWLYLAGWLQLVALVRRLVQFYKGQLISTLIGVIANRTAAVFTRRVLECLPREVLVEGFLTGCMNDPAVGQVTIAGSSKLHVNLTSPETAAWFVKERGAQIEAQQEEIGQVLRQLDAE